MVRTALKQLFIGIISLTSVLTLFSYFGNYDPPVSFIRAQASTTPVYPGGVLSIDWTVERSRRCYTRFDHYVTDANGKRWTLTDVIREGGLPVMHRDEFSVDIGMPTKIAPGRAKYVSTALYSCNLWQFVKPIMVPAPEVDFTIYAKPEGAVILNRIDRTFVVLQSVVHAGSGSEVRN